MPMLGGDSPAPDETEEQCSETSPSWRALALGFRDFC